MKKPLFTEAFCKENTDYKALTFVVSFDFKFAALFLWIMLFFASLSIRETSEGSFSEATVLSSKSRKLLIALRIVFA